MYFPLNINSNLEFYDSGYIPYETLEFGIKSNRKVDPLNLEAIYESYSFRFGSARFILLLWKKSASAEEIVNTNNLIETLFPYKNILNENLILEKVNDAFLTNYTSIIIGNVGLSISDNKLLSLVPDLENTQKYLKEVFQGITAESDINIEKLVIDSYNNKVSNLSKEE